MSNACHGKIPLLGGEFEICRFANSLVFGITGSASLKHPVGSAQHQEFPDERGQLTGISSYL